MFSQWASNLHERQTQQIPNMRFPTFGNLLFPTANPTRFWVTFQRLIHAVKSYFLPQTLTFFSDEVQSSRLVVIDEGRPVASRHVDSRRLTLGMRSATRRFR